MANNLPLDDLDTMGGAASPPRNRTFLILAILLVFVIFVGLVVIILAAIDARNRDRILQQTRVAIEQTNAAVFDALTRTTIAQTWTRTPTPTPTFTNTPTPTPTFTSSPTPTLTLTPTVDIAATEAEGTRVAILTQTFQFSALNITETAQAFATLFAQQTQNAALLLTLTAQARGDATPDVVLGTPIFTTPTPIGFLVTISPSPTFGLVELGTPGAPLALVTVAPGATPTPRALPEGGFFDDIGLGGSSPNSLPAIGLLALGLLAIIFVARRLRVKD
jgi:hypothetical protein